MPSSSHSMGLHGLSVEQRILCLAARTQLDHTDESSLLDLLSTPPNWEHLWEQAQYHQVLPLLMLHLRRLQHQVTIPSEFIRRAQQHCYAVLLHNIHLTDELSLILAAFQNAGVDAVSVKGVVLAETQYGDLGLRSTADLDVLVRPHDLPTARAVLNACGFEHHGKPGVKAWHHPWHDPPYIRRTPSGTVVLELHWALWPSHFFRRELSKADTPHLRFPWMQYATRIFPLQTEVFWARTIVTTVRGVSIPTLSPEDTLVHLAIHQVYSPLRLRLICDIAELLRRHSTTLDWPYILQKAGQAGARTTLFLRLRLAYNLLDAPLPPGVLQSLRVSRIRRWFLTPVADITALFGPQAGGNASKPPPLSRRLLEQDRIPQIVIALAYSLVLTSYSYLYRYRHTDTRS